VKYIGKPKRIQYPERLRGVSVLHLIGLGGRPLQHDCADCGEYHDQDQKDHAGLNGSDGAPRFVANCTEI